MVGPLLSVNCGGCSSSNPKLKTEFLVKMLRWYSYESAQYYDINESNVMQPGGGAEPLQGTTNLRSQFHISMILPPLLLKVDVPILPCVFYTFNWLTMTSEMHFVRFHPEVTSCLLSRGKTKYATLGMRLWCKYIRNYLLVYQLTSHFLQYLQNYKEFEGEISD